MTRLENDTGQMLVFFHGFSEFYPNLDRHQRQVVIEKFIDDHKAEQPDITGTHFAIAYNV